MIMSIKGSMYESDSPMKQFRQWLSSAVAKIKREFPDVDGTLIDEMAQGLVSKAKQGSFKLSDESGVYDALRKRAETRRDYQRRQKTMPKQLTRLVKAAPEGMPADDEISQQVDEPWGAQILRRMHQDASMLMQEYDQMTGPLENEKVKAHLQSCLENMEKFLGDTEGLWGKEYKDLPGLEGMVGAKDLTEEEAAEVDEDAADIKEEMMEDQAEDGPKDLDTMDDAAVPAEGNSEEDEPTPEEALEGMKKEKRNGRHKTKTLKARKKSVCPECGKEDCKCGTKIAPLVAAAAPAVIGAIAGQLQSHEKAFVKEAAGFLEEVQQAQEWTDEHRFNSYHYHKTMKGIADFIQENADSRMQQVQDAAGGKALTEEEVEQLKREMGEQSEDEEDKDLGSGLGQAARAATVGYLAGNVMDSVDDTVSAATTGPLARKKGAIGAAVGGGGGAAVGSHLGGPVGAAVGGAAGAAAGHVAGDYLSSRKMCKDASDFFHELSKTSVLEDQHREKAGHWSKQLGPLGEDEEAEEEMTEEGEVTEEPMEATGEMVEPGDMDMKELEEIVSRLEAVCK